MKSPREYYEHVSADGCEPDWLQRLSKMPGLRAVSRAEVAGRFIRGGQRVLDYGCGDGGFLLEYAAPLFRQAIGVDLAQSAIDRARTRAAARGVANVEFIKIEEGAALPFGDKYFDCVASLAVLEHVFWPPGLLAEFHRVLRPSGRLVVEVPNVGWCWHRLQALLGRFPNTAPGTGRWPGVDDGHVRFFTVGSLRAIVAQAGFQTVDISCAGRGAPFRQWWVGVLGADIVLVADRI